MEHSFEKIGEDYLFKVFDTEQKFKQEKTYTKGELIKVLNGIKSQLETLKKNVADANSKIIEVNKYNELDKFIELLDKADKYKANENIKTQVEKQNKDIIILTEQVNDIEKALEK